MFANLYLPILGLSFAFYGVFSAFVLNLAGTNFDTIRKKALVGIVRSLNNHARLTIY